jgi:hypothetical protein
MSEEKKIKVGVDVAEITKALRATLESAGCEAIETKLEAAEGGGVVITTTWAEQ